ncbi:hypothetical protein [Flavobacterium collinsii]|uniref:Uncharacterized protein n=2 Tax=Flavobacterium collinsii TaxID=1114861 RepID=A0A9W4TIJ1_9FLAO|nr:hypothetical protein [Flavobacterium collinsii]CAI2767609.1 conserved protein of unknown function [Flavobacterium collinsii]
MKITKIYYALVLICCLLTPFFSFTIYRQYCYVIGNSFEKMMRVEKLTRDPSSSKRISTTIYGQTDGQKVYFSSYDDGAYDFMLYMDTKTEQSIDYNNLTPLKLYVPVVKFGTSKFVLYIKKEQTKDDAIKENLYPWIFIEILSFGLLLTFFILKKKYEKKN